MMIDLTLKGSFRAFVLLLAAAAVAQASPPLACVAASGVPPTRRLEAVADFVGDLVLLCTGGTPTAAGVAVPMETLSLTLNNFSFTLNMDLGPINVTSRLLAPDWSEALLMIDEPHPASQLVCGAPGTTVISTGVCSILGNGIGVSYDGSTGRPNVFQARMGAPNLITWTIPLDAPSAAGTRILRITNVRGNMAAAIGGGPGTPASVGGTTTMPGIVISGIFGSGPEQSVAFVQPSLLTSVPTVPTLNRCIATNASLFANPAAAGTVTFVVRFGGSFLHRVAEADRRPLY